MTVSEDWFYEFKDRLLIRMAASIREHVDTDRNVDYIPAAGFVKIKCCELDQIEGDHERTLAQMWDMDHDFIELADALRAQHDS